MSGKVLTLGVTGRRPKYFPWGYDESDSRCCELKNIIISRIVKAIEEGYTRFATGVALGSDTYFAEEVLKLKDTYPHIELVSFVPFPSQSDYWTNESKRRYQRILDESAEVITTSERYFNRAFAIRDRRLVDACDSMLAIWDRTKKGGTWDTIEYAQVQGKNVDIVDYRSLHM